MKKIIIIIMLLFFLSGCATFPPTKITDNHYQNYRYGFVLDMPGGEWKVSKTVPQWFPKDQINGEPELLLFNNTVNGILAIFCGKSMIQIFPKEGDSIYKQRFRASMRDRGRKNIEAQIKKLEDANKNNPSVTSYSYEEINPYSDTEIAWLSKMETENEFFKAGNKSKIYIYPLKSDTVGVTITIDYLLANQEEALRIWDKLIESFKHGDEFTKVVE